MSSNLIKVENNPDLVRDKNNSAILNTANDQLARYREERAYRQRVERVVNNFDSVRNDLNEIKMLLNKLMEK